jgi:methionyl-tRNA formyltransferase
VKIVFFGSSDFAIPSLQALVEAGLEPVRVVTKPDAPRGRGRKINPAEVRLAAESLGLPCDQPQDANSAEFRARLAKLEPDIGIVVSYGVILGKELLSLPERGCVNAHASLLPAYRGAAPIQHAIRDGCTETGISIIQMTEEVDAGDVLLQEATPIADTENAGDLRLRLSGMAGQVLVKALRLIDAGQVEPRPQDPEKASQARKIEKPEGVIRWQRTAAEISLLVRAMTPRPGAQTRLGAKRYIVIEGAVEPDIYGLGVAGMIQSAGEEGIRVCTGKDLFRITRIKPENGRNMSAGEFVRGHPLPPDARFG